ncbi:MAG: hypothetical protein LQ349_004606 [Xanthoria aureola]|nr:MAG: hypothetical protein LQ349_004606 [Xanthoria aureola]
MSGKFDLSDGIEEAKSSAMEAFEKALTHKDSDKAIIGEAKKREEKEYGTLNRVNVGKAKDLYTKNYHFSAVYVATHVGRWILGEWLPVMLKKYGSMVIKTKETEKRDHFIELTYWRFLEWEWFPANDYAKIQWYIPLVRYYRARTFAKADEHTRDVFHQQIRDVLEEHM